MLVQQRANTMCDDAPIAEQANETDDNNRFKRNPLRLFGQRDEDNYQQEKISQDDRNGTDQSCGGPPWSDGAVERLGKELLRVFRSIVSELQMRFEEWPDLLPVVQSALNNGPSPQRRDISPITSFLGRDPTPPIGTFLRTKNTETVTLGDGDRERMLNVSLLKKRVADLHPMVGMELEAN